MDEYEQVNKEEEEQKNKEEKIRRMNIRTRLRSRRRRKRRTCNFSGGNLWTVGSTAGWGGSSLSSWIWN